MTFSMKIGYLTSVQCMTQAAEGILKRQAHLAVLRGRCQIQNAMDLYNFGKNFLSTTKSEICKMRIFKYIEAISRNKNIYYKPVDN